MDQTETVVALIAFIVFGLSIGIEWWVWHSRGRRKFVFRDSLANYALLFMQMGFDVAAKAIFVVWSLNWVRQHGPGLALDSWWGYPVLFLGVDLGYYWFHRLSHRVRFLWAVHVTHHSSELMNLTTALRQPPLEHLIDWLFFLPLAWLGFSAQSVLLMYGFNLIYQFFIHTELVRRLPRWVELVFNTPSHHRVHHGTNSQYLDVNYGGVLIIWDRIFGTFVEEKEPVRYGILHPVNSYNPLYLGFHLWADIWRDVLAMPSLYLKLKAIMAPPGWSEEYRQTNG